MTRFIMLPFSVARLPIYPSCWRMRKASAGVGRFSQYQRAIFCGILMMLRSTVGSGPMVDRFVQIQHLLQRCHILSAGHMVVDLVSLEGAERRVYETADLSDGHPRRCSFSSRAWHCGKQIFSGDAFV